MRYRNRNKSREKISQDILDPIRYLDPADDNIVPRRRRSSRSRSESRGKNRGESRGRSRGRVLQRSRCPLKRKSQNTSSKDSMRSVSPSSKYKDNAKTQSRHLRSDQYHNEDETDLHEWYYYEKKPKEEVNKPQMKHDKFNHQVKKHEEIHSGDRSQGRDIPRGQKYLFMNFKESREVERQKSVNKYRPSGWQYNFQKRSEEDRSVRKKINDNSLYESKDLLTRFQERQDHGIKKEVDHCARKPKNEDLLDRGLDLSKIFGEYHSAIISKDKDESNGWKECAPKRREKNRRVEEKKNENKPLIDYQDQPSKLDEPQSSGKLEIEHRPNNRQDQVFSSKRGLRSLGLGDDGKNDHRDESQLAEHHSRNLPIFPKYERLSLEDYGKDDDRDESQLAEHHSRDLPVFRKYGMKLQAFQENTDVRSYKGIDQMSSESFNDGESMHSLTESLAGIWRTPRSWTKAYDLIAAENVEFETPSSAEGEREGRQDESQQVDSIPPKRVGNITPALQKENHRRRDAAGISGKTFQERADILSSTKVWNETPPGWTATWGTMSSRTPIESDSSMEDDYLPWDNSTLFCC